MTDMRDSEELQGVTKPLRSATYLLRFTPEEKAELEQKVRRAAAAGNYPLSLAEALRMGVNTYLDELLEKLGVSEKVTDDGVGRLSA